MTIASVAAAGRRRAPDGLGWYLGGALAAVVVAATALLTSPLVVPVLVAGAVAVYLAAFKPKVFALVGVLAVVLSTLVQAALGSIAGYTDEAVVVLALVAFTTRRLVTRGRLVAFPGAAFFLVFIGLGLTSSFVNAVPLTITAEALLLITKGLLFAFALAQLEWTEKDLAVLARAGAVAIVVMLLSGLVNLAAPGLSAAATNAIQRAGVGGLPALTGLFEHPAAFGRFCAILAVGALVYGVVVRSSWANVALVTASVGLAMLTFQVKSLVGMIVALAAVGFRLARPVTLWAVLALGPLVGLLLWPPLSGFVGADIQQYVVQDSARLSLTLGSFDVANQHAPLGAGFGRYGSYPASEHYSPEYVSRHFEGVFGLGRDEKGMFLNDTQWPALIGETGWFGALAFLLGVIAVFVLLLRRTSEDEPTLVRWIRITGVGWLTLLLVESIAGPVFVSAPSYPFVFAAAGIVASFASAAREREREARRPLVTVPAEVTTPEVTTPDAAPTAPPGAVR